MIQLPERFVERMKLLLGEEYPAFAESYEKERVQGLRFNSLKTAEGEREDWEQSRRRGESSSSGRTDRLSSDKGTLGKRRYYYDAEDRPGRHPYHEAGVYYIQEPSAMAVVELLDPRPGDKVLDLCAAPGGKSSHIASRLKGQGFLLSNEIHPARAKILSQNIERMGVGNAVVTNEAPAGLAPHFQGFFNKIVVDAPCSGEGMFRKDEEARNQWSEEHVKMCADRQVDILETAASMLAPGGRLVYSTCTFAPEENEGAIQRFLACHEEFEAEKVLAYEGFTAGNPQWANQFCDKMDQEEVFLSERKLQEQLSRTFRILPHKLEGEGHYMAVLKKAEGLETAELSAPVYLNEKKQKELLKEYQEFIKEELPDCRELLNRKEYVLFGEQLYLLPPEMPDLTGLKVVRPGLHLGTLKKKRFEPSHALALHLKKSEARNVCDLPSDSMEVIRYLKGETLTDIRAFGSGADKGWVLVCVDGFSLGWGKLAGGILKNHYPKGLRRMG